MREARKKIELLNQAGLPDAEQVIGRMAVVRPPLISLRLLSLFIIITIINRHSSPSSSSSSLIIIITIINRHSSPSSSSSSSLIIITHHHHHHSSSSSSSSSIAIIIIIVTHHQHHQSSLIAIIIIIIIAIIIIIIIIIVCSGSPDERHAGEHFDRERQLQVHREGRHHDTGATHLSQQRRGS